MKNIYALMMCMAVSGAALFAQTAADFTTKAERNGVVITGYKGKGGNVTIPATIGGKAVVGIGEGAFAYSSMLNSVTIPAGVTSIGKEAFFMCYGLSAVNIPDGVTSIGESAFAVCASLTSVSIPDSVTSIGALAFNASSLKTVSLSSKTKLGNHSFPDTAQLVYRDAEGSAGAGGVTAEEYSRRGLAFLNKKDYDSALTNYSQAIRLAPDYGEAYKGRGTAYYAKGDYDRAIADLTEAIRLDPHEALLYSARATAYAMKKNFAQAKADFETALKIDPNDAYSRSTLEMFRQQGY